MNLEVGGDGPPQAKSKRKSLGSGGRALSDGALSDGIKNYVTKFDRGARRRRGGVWFS